MTYKEANQNIVNELAFHLKREAITEYGLDNWKQLSPIESNLLDELHTKLIKSDDDGMFGMDMKICDFYAELFNLDTNKLFSMIDYNEVIDKAFSMIKTEKATQNIKSKIYC